jgi:NAD(P)-dependent dehydrogenase (short-subunit alcohol dehydrogenase family)
VDGDEPEQDLPIDPAVDVHDPELCTARALRSSTGAWWRKADARVSHPTTAAIRIDHRRRASSWSSARPVRRGDERGEADGDEHQPGQRYGSAARLTGLIGFTRSLASEVEDGITVNLLTPDLTLTGPVLEHFPRELISSQREQ